MKRLLAFFLLSVSVGLCAENSFKEEYYRAKELCDKAAHAVYNGAVTPKWTGDGSFIFETAEKDGAAYYAVDIAEKAKAKISKEEFEELSKKAGAVKQPAAEEENALYKQPNPEFPTKDPFTSPDKSWRAYIIGYNIWVEPNRDGGEKDRFMLSLDGTENSPYIFASWSPDSKKIAALKAVNAQTHSIPLLQSSPPGQLQPALHWKYHYKAGDSITKSFPALFNVETRQKMEVDGAPFEKQYWLGGIRWMKDSRAFTFEFNERGHRHYKVVSVDADTGETFTVIDESAGAFVFSARIYRHYTENDGSIIWASERDNWRHLYEIDRKTGRVLRQLTKGEWVVRGVVDVDEKNGHMIISGNGRNAAEGEDPYNIHYYRVSLKDGEITDLTPENGNHEAFFSPDFEYLVDNWSRPDLPNTSVVRSAKDGKTVVEIQKADIGEPLAMGFAYPEPFKAKGRDGKTDIWGLIYRPFNFDPEKSYPVVEQIYTGPQQSFVPKSFHMEERNYVLAQMGFIVVVIDGMGTADRSKAFHDVVWKNVKDGGFPDRIPWIRAAAKKYPYMDLDRVGIYGYSSGGQSAAAALIWHNDFYKAAVSLCGDHDLRMGKISVAEQYMGWPVGAHYAENSNVQHAHMLKGGIMIVNGDMDESVDPASSLQLANALVRADKDFEQLYLPNHTHWLGGDYVDRRVFGFLAKHLAPAAHRDADNK